MSDLRTAEMNISRPPTPRWPPSSGGEKYQKTKTSKDKKSRGSGSKRKGK